MIEHNSIGELSIYDYAQQYESLGFKLLKIIPRKKNPAGSWINGTEAHVTSEYYKNNSEYGIGVIGGSASGIYILDVDDKKASIEYFKQYDIDITEYRTKTACFHRGNPNKFKLVFLNPKREDIGYVDLIHTEMRGDAIHQDVFPPSIHTEGQKYTWENGLDKIIELPPELRAIWNLEIKQKQDIIKSIKSPSNETKKAIDGSNVFDVYNRLVGGESALLSRPEYTRVGNRWKPTKSKNTAGIVVYDGFIISSQHMSSDPMIHHMPLTARGALAYTPFHMLWYLDHGGNITAATAEAYKYCEERGHSFNNVGVVLDLEALKTKLEEKRKTTQKNAQSTIEVPENILRIPGKAQGLVDAFNESAFIYQPQFAVQTSLAVVATLMGRRYKTDKLENLTNFFFEIVGDSSSGKNHCKKFVKTVLGLVDVFIPTINGKDITHSASKLIGSGEYKSGAGLFNACARKPCHINVMDEAGIKQDAQNKSEHGSGVKAGLLDQWSSATTSIFKGTYSGGDITQEDLDHEENKIDEVVRPCIIKLGLSTPKTYYDSMKSGDIESGYLGRHLIVESKYNDRDFNIEAPKIRDCIDSTTINWLKGVFTAYNYAPNADNFDPNMFMTSMSSPGTPPEPIPIYISRESLLMFKQLYSDIIKKYGQDNSLSMKSMEMAVRISMMVALSCEETTITIEHSKWAKEYVCFYINQMVESSNMKISGSKYESDWKEIYEIIYCGKEDGANKRDFDRKKSCAWNGANGKQQIDLLQTIQNAKEIIFVRVNNNKPGVKRCAWIDNEFYNPDLHTLVEYDYKNHGAMIR